MCTQTRVDDLNFNTGEQSCAQMVYDLPRAAVHVAYACRGSSGASTTHNREVRAVSIDVATKTPNASVQVEATQTANDLDAISQALLDDGTLLIGYGQFGVRVKESTNGGTSWPTSTDVDGTWGASTRGMVTLMTDGTTCWCITQEAGGGGTQADIYMRKRTGSGTWGTQSKIHDASAPGTQFSFDQVRAGCPRVGIVVSDQIACIVGDYTNGTSFLDQVRCLYTTDGWTTSATSVVKDYTGVSTGFRNPIAVMGSGGVIYCMWVEGSDPVFAYSEDNGASWTYVGSPAALAAVPWDSNYDRTLAIDGEGSIVASAFDPTDGSNLKYHIWRNTVLELTGWNDLGCTHLTQTCDSQSVGDALVVEDVVWRLYSATVSSVGETWMLFSDSLPPADPVPPESERLARGNVILATITLPEYDVNPEKVLHLSNRPYVDADGLRWDPLLAESPPIDHGGGYLQTDVQIADAVLGIVNGRISGQGLNERLSLLTKQYPIIGARCHIEQGFVGIPNLKTLLDGEVAELDALKSRRLEFHIAQDRKSDRTVPLRTINPNDDPAAPKDMYGERKQIATGDWKEGRYRDPHTSTAAAIWGTLRGLMPVQPITSQTAAGDDYPSILVSDKECYADAGGLFIYESALNQYAMEYVTPTESNPPGGPDVITFDQQQFVCAVLPVGAFTGTGIADCKELLREDKPFDLNGHNDLDYDAGHVTIEMTFGDSRPDGEFVAMEVWIAYAKNAWTGTLGKFGMVQRPGFASLQSMQAFPAGASAAFPSATPVDVAAFTVDPTVVGSWEMLRTAILRIDTRAAGQKLNIHRVVPVVRYIPSGRTLRPGKLGSPIYSISGRYIGRGPAVPELRAIDTKLFALPQGVPDQNHDSGAADGAYTGSAGNLIENPADLVHWALRELGGVDADGVKTSGFGRFNVARAALSNYKFFCVLNDPRKLYDWIADVSEQSLCWFMRCPTEPHNPWIAVPWDVGAAPDYRSSTDLFTFRRKAGHVAIDTFNPGKTRVSNVRNVVRVNYDWDMNSGAYADTMFITDADSRVYSGGSFTTDGTREARSALSVAQCGLKERIFNLRYVKDPATASDILTRAHDLMCFPKPNVVFQTFVNAYDLNRGHVIQFDGDWDALYTFPREGSDGSWVGKAMRVVSVKRLKGSVVRYQVEAVEA